MICKSAPEPFYGVSGPIDGSGADCQMTLSNPTAVHANVEVDIIADSLSQPWRKIPEHEPRHILPRPLPVVPEKETDPTWLT